MGKRHTHRRGSLAFNPRKRADSQMPRVNAWPTVKDKRLLGFAGYKAGMTHFAYTDDTESPNKGSEVVASGTIIEVPPMVVFGVRGMKAHQAAGDMITADEKILKEMGMKLKNKNELDAASLDDVFVLAYTRPSLCNFGKKHIERMEIAVGGKDVAEKLEYAKSLLGKEVKFSDVFKAGEFLDSIAVTIGKGWQGSMKRFGTSKQRRKATNKQRHIGTLGPWHPGYVMYTIPRPGQMGYHRRTELNKRIMKIAQPSELNQKGGFLHYGPAQNECVLVKGSVGGPAKRLIRFRKAMRKTDVTKAPDLKFISVSSKQ